MSERIPYAGIRGIDPHCGSGLDPPSGHGRVGRRRGKRCQRRSDIGHGGVHIDRHSYSDWHEGGGLFTLSAGGAGYDADHHDCEHQSKRHDDHGPVSEAICGTGEELIC
jgi:hypothetical protein